MYGMQTKAAEALNATLGHPSSHLVQQLYDGFVRRKTCIWAVYRLNHGWSLQRSAPGCNTIMGDIDLCQKRCLSTCVKECRHWRQELHEKVAKASKRSLIPGLKLLHESDLNEEQQIENAPHLHICQEPLKALYETGTY